MKLKGSTLVEAIVASAIFLIIFIISLNTLNKIVIAGNSDEYALIEADYNMDICYSVYAGGTFPHGKYPADYSWGTIDVEIKQYGEYTDIDEIVITATINNNHKKMIRRHLVEKNRADL